MADENKAVKKEKFGFFKGVKNEFKKIVWPDKQSAFRQTIMVIIVTIVLGVLIKLFDTGIQALLNLVA